MSSGQAAAPTLKLLIDDGLQQALAEAGSTSSWESGLSRVVAAYVGSPLPYQLLAYSSAARTVNTFASLPLLLAWLRRRRGLRAKKKQKLAVEGGGADTGTTPVSGVSATVHEMEDEVRAMLSAGRLYEEAVVEDDTGMYRESMYTNEWGVLQGEHLTLQQRLQPALVATPPSSTAPTPSSSSSSPAISAAPVPVSTLRFPVALFLVDETMHNKPSQRDPPGLMTFYEAQQLSLWLWQRPDGISEQDEGGRASRLQPDYEPLPPPDDDPLPRLLRAMQSEMWRDSGSAAIHDARRVDCTAEDERRDKHMQEQWNQEVRHSRVQAEHCVLTAEEEQRMRQLMAALQSFRHPTRPQQQQQQSQASVAEPSASVPDSSLPPAALLTLLRDTLDLMQAEHAVCSAADLPHKYWEWVERQQLLDVMDDVLPAGREPGTKDDVEHQVDGWAGVEKLLAAIFSSFDG